MIRYQPTHSQITVRSHNRIKDCMAEAMLELAFGGTPVTEESLESRGFTPAAIRRFHREASNMARRKSIRRVEACTRACKSAHA